jgi:hypothetical protein
MHDSSSHNMRLPSFAAERAHAETWKQKQRPMQRLKKFGPHQPPAKI